MAKKENDLEMSREEILQKALKSPGVKETMELFSSFQNHFNKLQPKAMVWTVSSVTSQYRK